MRPEVGTWTPDRGKFLLHFFALIQFWQIWQNDLFTEKLEKVDHDVCIHLRYIHDFQNAISPSIVARRNEDKF